MNRSCFTCKYRYQQLAPDGWGNRPYRCSAKGGYRLAWGQDGGCELWEEKNQEGGGMQYTVECSKCGIKIKISSAETLSAQDLIAAAKKGCDSCNDIDSIVKGWDA